MLLDFLKKAYYSNIYKQMVFVLTFLSIFSIIEIRELSLILNIFSSLLAALIHDYLKFGKIKESSIITSFFIAGILHPINPLIIFASTIIALLSKDFIRYKSLPIYNPAALSLSIFYFLGFPHSWWISFSLIPIIVFGIILMYKFKRLEMVLTFILTYNILSSILFKVDILNLNIWLDKQLLFFSFFMLTEPKTSPFTKKGRIIYSLFSAIIALLLFQNFPALNYLAALIIANFSFFYIRFKFKI